jgi:hypothetical protein
MIRLSEPEHRRVEDAPSVRSGIASCLKNSGATALSRGTTGTIIVHKIRDIRKIHLNP